MRAGARDRGVASAPAGGGPAGEAVDAAVSRADGAVTKEVEGFFSLLAQAAFLVRLEVGWDKIASAEHKAPIAVQFNWYRR